MLDQLLEKLTPAITLFGQSPLMKALVIILISTLLARLVGIIVNRVIRRLTERTASTLDDKILDLIQRPLFWTVTLLGLLLAAMVADIPATAVGLIRSILITALIVWWMQFLLRVTRLTLLSFSINRTPTSVLRPQTLPLFTNLSAVIIYGVKVDVAWGVVLGDRCPVAQAWIKLEVD